MAKQKTRILTLAAALTISCGLIPAAMATSSDEPKKAEKSAKESKGQAGASQDAKKAEPAEVKLSPLMQAAQAAQANRDRSKIEKVPSFTTEDLAKRFGAGSAGGVYTNEPATADAAPGQDPNVAAPTGGPATDGTLGDPLQAMQQREAEQAVRAKKNAEAQAAVTRLTEQIAELEKRSLAISNPYLARPKIDEKDPAKEEWDKSSAAERRDKTQQQIERLRKQLADAQKALNESNR